MFGVTLMGFMQQSAEQSPNGGPAHVSLPGRLKAWWAGPCPGCHPFKVRLAAWWDGRVLPPPPVVVDEQESEPVLSKAEEVDATEAAKPAEQWSKERVAILESVFGEGALTPGGLPAILTLVKPLGLDPTMSVLEFGAGIGGAARLLVKEFDTWVTGIESSLVLVEMAHERNEKTGMTKKASVLQGDLNQPEIRAKYYNAIYSRDALYTVGVKDTLLANLVLGLRPKGMITFIDYVAADDLSLVSTEITAWKAREPASVHLWTAERYRKALTMQKLDVRTVEDISGEVCNEIISAWGSYLKTLDIKALSSSAKAGALVREAELWASRYKALSSGRLRSIRIFAMKK